MISIIGTVIGGIGLFLLGMILMTDGLKALAGDALRSILARFTTNRFSALATGAAATAVVQSSSATTLATIGFVSAGLLTFQNAAGVIIGANLGTTSTGWLVSLLGLKFSIGSIMLPVIGFGALAKLMGKGKIAQAGMALAGFGVIFVGIDTLQAGMKDLSSVFDPADFPAGGLGARVLLVLIGAGMTVVMQSSSAAVATTLAALSGGTINLEQAAALVIGQNVGTTVTAGIAAIGASTAAKRTAVVHVIFNAGTGLVAFLVLPWFTAGVEGLSDSVLVDDDAVTIAAFHTAFNLLGLAIFVPLLPQFSRLVERIVKQKGPRLTQHLDPSLASVPPVAIEAARRTLKEGGADLYEYLAAHLHSERRPPGIELIEELDLAWDETRRFLAKIPPPDTQGYEFHRQISTMHAIDHLERLTAEARDYRKLKPARQDQELRVTCTELAKLLELLATQLREPNVEPEVERAQDFSLRLADERRTARPAILAATAARKIDPDQALAELSAQRWLDRVAYHLWRTSHHLREMTRKELAQQALTSADAGMSGERDEEPEPDA
jgi:phosphate:Na+ symporter